MQLTIEAATDTLSSCHSVQQTKSSIICLVLRVLANSVLTKRCPPLLILVFALIPAYSSHSYHQSTAVTVNLALVVVKQHLGRKQKRSLVTWDTSKLTGKLRLSTHIVPKDHENPNVSAFPTTVEYRGKTSLAILS